MKSIRILVISGAIGLLIGAFFTLRAYTIAGPSYLLNDRVIAKKYLLRGPERGDVIVYFDANKNSVAVKRLIGLPGDHVKMVDNILFVNEERMNQEQEYPQEFSQVPEENGLGKVIAQEDVFGCKHLITYTPNLIPQSSFEEIELKEDQYFILGDHRDNSADSRFVGPIRLEQIQAKVVW